MKINNTDGFIPFGKFTFGKVVFDPPIGKYFSVVVDSKPISYHKRAGLARRNALKIWEVYNGTKDVYIVDIPENYNSKNAYAFKAKVYKAIR